ncbi:type IX secretion system periplasmic lipoprotein PorW/SprE [Tenacibaculum xiamenense]|uniref:type IX secretion system periplasmic lipoprotein PorW/SprE n=1 Tax=Tenacibaculum xiamenense TaxID=1261553 RepID=UPI003895B2EF
MKKLSKILVFSIVFAIVYSCGTRKNTFVNRNFHALTTKYNVLFNGEQAFLKGLKEIEEKHEDNFWKRLPIEPITFNENTIEAPSFKPGTGFDDSEEEEESKPLSHFDKAEEKAVKAVQKHSMNIDGIERNGKIDEAYLLLGKARYYTQRFIPAVEALNYVISNYPKASLIYDTKIWRAKANIRLDNEKLAIETLNLLIELDKNEKSLTDTQRERAHTAMAMAYEKTDTIQKVIEHLALASRTFKNKEQSARNMFILGQIYSELDRRDSARMVFQKLADTRRAPRKYRIRANIELAKNTENDSASVLVLSRLKKLIRNTDNREFLNSLYYQAGVLEVGRNKIDNAIEYFNKSLRAKKNSDYQRTYAYEQLGNIAFDKQEYVLAGTYYDSVLGKVSKEFDTEKRIRRIRRKNKGLTTLRKYEETVKTNDSILKVVAMSDDERKEFFQEYIDKVKKEDEERRQQLLNAQNFGSSFGSTSLIGSNAKGGKWYFYNDQTIQFGKVEFQRVWGNRPLEDNWRLSDKDGSLIAEDDTTDSESEEEKVNPKYELATYLDAIPTKEEDITKLKEDRNDALYQLGLIYKEQFKNTELATSNFERLLSIEGHKQSDLAINYHLYQVYLNANDEEKAKKHKDIVLSQYPDSKFAQIIREPNVKLVEEKKTDEVLNRYKEIYIIYKLNKFEEALVEIDKFEPRVKDSNLIPKLALLKALCIGKCKDQESYKKALEFVSLSYSNTDAGKKAEEILEQLSKSKINPIKSP